MKAKFILSKKIIKEKLKEVSKLADIVSYSFKTNYKVGEILEKTTNCNFSIHSIDNLRMLKNKKRVYFFAQAWNHKEIEELIKLGVRSFVVDNEKDLNILLRSLKNKEKINLFLRMRLKEHTVHTGKHFVFGFYSNEINKLIPKLRKNKEINKLGIHFHRKTQNISEWSLKEELEDSLDKNTLKNIDYINIGGGLPYIYKNFRLDLIKTIFNKIIKLKLWLNKQNIKMIIEPGRYIAAPSIKLVTKIKNIYNNNIIVNCSVYNSAMDTFIANIRLLVDGEVNNGIPYVIKGSTPDSLDIFRYRVFFKKRPKIGDKIILLNAGAYNFSTEFCNLPRLKTEIID